MSVFLFTREVVVEDRSLRQTALVVAEDSEQATKLLTEEVAAIGALVSRAPMVDADTAYVTDAPWTIDEISLADPRVIILSLTS